MDYWDFISVNEWFGAKLPTNWAEYDDDEGTAAFFNTDKWSGNLRITQMRLEDTELDKRPAPANDKSDDKPNSIPVKLGNWNSTFYSKESSDGFIMYYWTMGSTNFWFMCSFAIKKEFLSTDNHTKEMAVVEEILSSIEILN